MKKHLATLLILVGASSAMRQIAAKEVEYYSSDPHIQEEINKAKHETHHGTEWNREEIKRLKEQYPGKIIEHAVPEDDD